MREGNKRATPLRFYTGGKEECLAHGHLDFKMSQELTVQIALELLSWPIINRLDGVADRIPSTLHIRDCSIE